MQTLCFWFHRQTDCRVYSVDRNFDPQLGFRTLQRRPLIIIICNVQILFSILKQIQPAIRLGLAHRLLARPPSLAISVTIRGSLPEPLSKRKVYHREPIVYFEVYFTEKKRERVYYEETIKEFTD